MKRILPVAVVFTSATNGFLTPSPSSTTKKPFLNLEHTRRQVKFPSSHHLLQMMSDNHNNNNNKDEQIPGWVRSIQNLQWKMPKREMKEDVVASKNDTTKWDINENDETCEITQQEFRDNNEGWPYLPLNGDYPLPEIINVEALLWAASVHEEELMMNNNTAAEWNYTDAMAMPSANATEIIASIPVNMTNWDTLVQSLQGRVSDILETQNTTSTTSTLFDNLLRDTTVKIDVLLQEARSTLNPLLPFLNNSTSSVAIPDALLQNILQKIRYEIAHNAVTQATDIADYTKQVYNFVNGVLMNGWHSKEKSLFRDNVEEVKRSHDIVQKAKDMAVLAGSIYLPENWNDEIKGDLNHAIVTNGTIEDVKFLITDSVRDGDLVRTITLRGFDATDGIVDRERLLKKICIAWPQKVELDNGKVVYVHSGLMGVAEQMYKGLTEYIDGVGDNHKIILNGHSIGGSLAVLLMMIMIRERGVQFVQSKIIQVYTFGSPPIATTTPTSPTPPTDSTCSILSALSLPPNFVLSFLQPWDPIVRLFSHIDPLYPLIDDLGPDGVTLFSQGPQRTLRPITKKILENWNGWPTLRSSLNEFKQSYVPIGTCYFLLPETVRYLTDRLVNVFVEVPPLDTILEVKGGGGKALDYLNKLFPLDEFRISVVPVALRSFVHHFFPAYSMSLWKFANNEEEEMEEDDVWSPEVQMKKNSELILEKTEKLEEVVEDVVLKKDGDTRDWANLVAQWVLGGDGKRQQV